MTTALNGDNAMSTIPATTNEVWGFYGTMRGHAENAWPLAMQAIAAATGEDYDSIRAFLDGRHGRHFADEVLDRMDRNTPIEHAIDETAAKWMTWRTTRLQYRQEGIPAGLPYLTAQVIACDTDEDTRGRA